MFKLFFKKAYFLLLIIFFSCELDDSQYENLCNELICELVCENGFLMDQNECEICECIVFGCTDLDATNYDDTVNTDDESCIYNYVYAGIYDENFIVTEFSPPLEIEIIWDKDNIYGFGSLSLEVDENNIVDLVFNLSNCNNDYFNKIPSTPYYFPSTGITPYDNFEFAFIEVGFYAGLGSYSSTDFVHKMNYQDRIDNLPLWKENYAAMFQENPTFIFPFGPWYSADGIYYIGIKKENKFGWIEIEMNGLNTFPKISKIAFQS